MLNCVIKLTALHKLCVWVWKTAKLSHQYHMFICTYITAHICSMQSKDCETAFRHLHMKCDFKPSDEEVYLHDVTGLLKKPVSFHRSRSFDFHMVCHSSCFRNQKNLFRHSLHFFLQNHWVHQVPSNWKTNKTENLIQDACSSLWCGQVRKLENSNSFLK